MYLPSKQLINPPDGFVVDLLILLAFKSALRAHPAAAAYDPGVCPTIFLQCAMSHLKHPFLRHECLFVIMVLYCILEELYCIYINRLIVVTISTDIKPIAANHLCSMYMTIQVERV